MTLDRPGKVLVFLSGTFTVTCGGTTCSRIIGASRPAPTRLKIMEKTTGPPAGETNGGDVRVTAIALGG